MPDRRDLRLDLLLDRYLDEVFLGDPAGSDLDTNDPDLAATVQRVHALNVEPVIRPTFENKLWEDLMFSTTTAGELSLRPSQPPAGLPTRLKVPTLSWPRLHVPAARRRWLIAQAALALLIVVALLGTYFLLSHDNRPAVNPTATPQPTPLSGWTTLRGSAARTGEGNAGPTGQPVQLWRFQANGACFTSPAAAGGAVYAACNDGVLYALYAATGTTRWQYSASRALAGDPTVAGDLVYVVDSEGTLIAVDIATGHERWHYDDLPTRGSPAVEDGLLAIGTPDGSLLGIDAATGEERWRVNGTTLNNYPQDDPAIANGIVYMADENGLTAVDALTGQKRWFGATGYGSTGTSVVAGGIAYVGAGPGSTSFASSLYAFNAQTGERLWQRGEKIFTPAVSNGVGYAGSDAGIVYAFDTATGKDRWQVQVGGVVQPPVVAAGIVYVPSDGDHAIHALDATTGAELWQFPVGGGIFSSIAVADGALYVTTTAGNIYAIGNTNETVATPAPAVATPAPVASPRAADSGLADYLWQTTGGPDGFNATFYVEVAPDGKVWANDAGKGRFQIFNSDGEYLETWAPEGVPADGNLGVDFDRNSNIYVIDGLNVRKYDAYRNPITSWGGFSNTTGIGIDAAGNVYVCDDLSNDVQKFDANGHFLAKWGSKGSGDGQFDQNGFMDVDPQGNSYVVDLNNHRVEKFAADGTYLLSFGATEGDGKLRSPNDVAIDAQGNLFVGEHGLGQIMVYAPDGTFLGKWGEFGSGEGQLTSADAVALDGAGNAYVDDNLSGRVVKFRLLPPLAPEATPTA
jgi:outer membrane protein assembly factor BamB